MRVALILELSLAVLTFVPRVRAQAKPSDTPVATVLQLDSNGDGTLERNEVPESGQAAFDKLLTLGDANKNGKLEADELRAMVGKIRALNAAGAGGFQALDRDGDGKLSKQEYPGPKALFPQIDTDQDGFITREEAGRFARSNGGFGAALTPARLKSMDRNGDGKLTKDEFTGPAALFPRLDANGDGFLTTDEATRLPDRLDTSSSPAGAGKRPSSAEKPPRKKSMDQDGDGKVSRAEFPGSPNLFERLDRNKDGSLSAEDLLSRNRAGLPRAKK